MLLTSLPFNTIFIFDKGIQIWNYIDIIPIRIYSRKSCFHLWLQRFSTVETTWSHLQEFIIYWVVRSWYLLIHRTIITLSQFQQFSALSGILCQRTCDTVQCGGALFLSISRPVISIGQTTPTYEVSSHPSRVLSTCIFWHTLTVDYQWHVCYNSFQRYSSHVLLYNFLQVDEMVFLPSD